MRAPPRCDARGFGLQGCMRRRHLPQLVALLLVGCHTEVTTAFRGNDGRTGEHDRVWVGPLDEIVWKHRFDAPIGGAPAIGSDALYVTNAAGELAALSVEDGRVLWSLDLDVATFGTPTLTKRRVLVGTDQGLVAVARDDEGNDGNLIWRYKTDPIEGAPLLVNGVAYVGTRAGRVLAIDEIGGSLVWESITAGAVVAPAVAVGDDLVAVAEDGGVYRLSATTGEPRWSWRAPAPIRGVAARGELVVVTAGREVIALSSDDPEPPKWRVDVGDRVTTPPSFSGSMIVVGTGGGQLVAVDHNDGTPAFKRAIGTSIRGDIHTVGGAIVVPIGEDGLATLDASGKVEWTFRTDGVVRGIAPVDHRLYLTDAEGSVYAIR